MVGLPPRYRGGAATAHDDGVHCRHHSFEFCTDKQGMAAISRSVR